MRSYYRCVVVLAMTACNSIAGLDEMEGTRSPSNPDGQVADQATVDGLDTDGLTDSTTSDVMAKDRDAEVD